MLSLSKIQQWHHSCFLVLWGVALQDLFDELIVLLGEFEGDVRVVVGSITMLDHIVREVQPMELSLEEVKDTYNVERIAAYPRAGSERPTLGPRRHAGSPEGWSEQIWGEFGCHCRSFETQW